MSTCPAVIFQMFLAENVYARCCCCYISAQSTEERREFTRLSSVVGLNLFDQICSKCVRGISCRLFYV